MEHGIITTFIPDEPIQIPLREVMRYMECSRSADQKTLELAGYASAEISSVASYRACAIRLPLTFSQGNPNPGWGPVFSASLGRALAGCTQILLIAATLGSGADIRIRRKMSDSPSGALALQAAGTAAVEAWCDSLCRRLARELRSEGMRMRPRFSPGYGDFSLGSQPEIFRLLDCPRKIGLTLTESLLMAPSKSVTAVIGLDTGKEECEETGCEHCEKNCTFRRTKTDEYT